MTIIVSQGLIRLLFGHEHGTKLPSTSSVVIGVNEIAPLQGSSGGNMTMSK
jgi:hypothetical protein